MSRRDEENSAFYDLCYEAWCNGHNPDDVSRDRFDDKLAAGFYPDEISYKSCLPHREQPQEEEQYQEQYQEEQPDA